MTPLFYKTPVFLPLLTLITERCPYCNILDETTSIVHGILSLRKEGKSLYPTENHSVSCEVCVYQAPD